MSTLRQFIDDFLQVYGDDAINAALGHEFIPPPDGVGAATLPGLPAAGHRPHTAAAVGGDLAGRGGVAAALRQVEGGQGRRDLGPGEGAAADVGRGGERGPGRQS